MTRARWLLAVLVAVRVVAVVVVIVMHLGGEQSVLTGDVNRYEQIVTAEGVPYRDFQIEYPPATYVLLRVAHADSFAGTVALVALASLALDLGSALVLDRVWNRRTCLAYLVLGTPLVVYPFIYLRIDLLSSFLTIAAVALIRRGKDLTGGAAFAAAVLAKIWPFAVAPLLVVERRFKGLVAAAVTGAALVAAWVGVSGLAGARQVVSFREATGWQLESLPGILWHIRDPSRVRFESGAFRTGVIPDWGRPLLTALSLAGVVLVWWLAERRRREGAPELISYGLAPLGAVLAMLVFAPILSPQYVVWFLPFAAIVTAAGDRPVGWLTLGVNCLSTLGLVLIFDEVDGELYATLPIAARNLGLVVLLGLVIGRLRATASVGSRTTAPS